ncbi:MAG: aspartyl/asparaginyl beta-hydroxylase domain-containing protein [Nonlabens sp.]
MQTDEKLWFSHRNPRYGGSFPEYFEPGEFPWAIDVERKAAQITQEVLEYLDNKRTPFNKYFNKVLTNFPNDWELVFFRFWGKQLQPLSQLPTLNTIFKNNDQLLSLGISKLAAGAAIKPHAGDSNAYVRCHLPIIVPDRSRQCFIEVNGKPRMWKKGKLLIFCDAYEHRAVNLLETDRIVLIFDVLLPHFAHNREYLIKDVRTSLFTQRYPILQRLPFRFLLWVNHYLRL